MWIDAAKLKTVKGAPPKQCDVLHHLSLHCEHLNEWASHAGPIPNFVWLEFAEEVLLAREKAKDMNIRWGSFAGPDDELVNEDDQLEMLSNQQPAPSPVN